MCFSVQSLGWEDPLEGGMATYSNILAWRILWSEEPGGLQPIRLQRVRHNWSDWAWCIFKYILLPQVFLSLYSHLTRGALGISNPHMNFGDIWDRDPCSWSLEYKVKWIVIILLYMVGWAIDKIMRNMLDRQQRGNASLFLLNYTVQSKSTGQECEAFRARTAAAAAKSLQSCPTLCDPIDGSPLGSPVPGILQARILEGVAIFFSNAWKWKVKAKSLSCIWLQRPHGLQSTRLLCPWDFPGKSTGVGCHCLLREPGHRHPIWTSSPRLQRKGFLIQTYIFPISEHLWLLDYIAKPGFFSRLSIK